MVNPDSDLAREHPAWVLRGRDDLPAEWRHQQVLDLQAPGRLRARAGRAARAARRVRHRLPQVGPQPRPDRHRARRPTGRARPDPRRSTRSSTSCGTRTPTLEIECCASGGGRVDLGVLARTDRIWPSDTIDALERQHIQRWTTLLRPTGDGRARTSAARPPTPPAATHRLAFRAATALLGHFGIEWDLHRARRARPRRGRAPGSRCTSRCAASSTTGTVVRGDHPDPAVLVTGVVAADRPRPGSSSRRSPPPPPRRPPRSGSPASTRPARYLVESVAPRPATSTRSTWARAGRAVRGSSSRAARSADVGVRMPVLAPESAHVLHVTSATAVSPVLDLPDHWVWDFWGADDGARRHLFFLKAPRALGDPDLRHRNASVGHAVSDDLQTWSPVADALAPRAVPGLRRPRDLDRLRGPRRRRPVADVLHRARPCRRRPRAADRVGRVRRPRPPGGVRRPAPGGRRPRWYERRPATTLAGGGLARPVGGPRRGGRLAHVRHRPVRHRERSRGRRARDVGGPHDLGGRSRR